MKESRTISLTIKLTVTEAASLKARASEAGVALRPYVRREVLRNGALPRHAALLLAKLERLEELNRRVWMAVAADELKPERVRQIFQAVDTAEG